MEYNINCDYEYNLKNIYNYIKQYYYSIVPEYWTIYNNCDRSRAFFGMDFYNKLNNYLVNSKGKKIDIRPFYLLYDHKKMMKLRLQYLITHTKNLQLPEEIFKYCDLLIEKNEIVVNLMLKYIICFDYSIITNVTCLLKEIYEIEKKRIEPFTVLFRKCFKII